MIVAKYKFDKSIYENLIPVFNDWYNGYTISDEIDGNIVTRTIECDTLPTVMRFGENTGQYEDNKIGAKAKSLKEVLYADISSITYGNHMFGSCINLTKINTEGWNNNSFASINNMFFCCKSLVNLDVTSLVGDTVVDVGYAFYYCAELYNLTGLESWDTSNVTYMANMFQNCFKLTPIDVSSWDTSNVKNMGAMFANCYKLTSLDVSNWDTSNVTNMWGVFYYCSNLTQLDVSNFDTSKVTDMSHMFYYCTNLTSITFGSNFNTSNVKAMDYMFCNCNKLTSLDVSNFDTSNVTRMDYMFHNCAGLTSLDVSNFDTSNVINMQYMFYHCNNLTSLDVSNFDTSNVTNMIYMFTNCNSLTSLDVSNWNTSNVTNMLNMFNYCTSLTSLDLSNWNTSKVTNMAYMFDNCNKLTSLDLSNFNTSKLTSTERLTNRWWYSTHSIGMLYCDKDTINKLTPLLKSNGTPTIWVKDIKPNKLTSVDGVEFKEYKENGVMINLSSPLLNGDRIEVKDGKLCHYHKMGMVVLDGSEDWITKQNNDSTMFFQFYSSTSKIKGPENNNIKVNLINDYFETKTPNVNYNINQIVEGLDYNIGKNIGIRIFRTKLVTQDVNGFKQWLQANPTTIIYELAEPYYEDITPIQSDIVLETYLESNLDIYTKLPIKTNLTYLTNIANTSSIEEEINAINEGTDLTNLLEDEINN